MDMHKFSGSSFLKVADIKASGPVKVKIAGVEEGKFGKPNVAFNDGTQLSLNTTNVRTLMRTFGSESRDWIGKEVVLMPGKVNYQGEPQDTIIVTATSPTAEHKAVPRPTINAQSEPDEDADSIPF
jgi:hypothetical protein